MGKSAHAASTERDFGPPPLAFSVVDIHTSEAPIEVSRCNLNLSLQQLGLIDLTINGVLDIFAVERKVMPHTITKDLGKDAIFLNGDAWVSAR